jgi:hypothetical protein
MEIFLKIFVKFQFPSTHGYHRKLENFTTECPFLMTVPESSWRPEKYFEIGSKLYYILGDNDISEKEIYTS